MVFYAESNLIKVFNSYFLVKIQRITLSQRNYVLVNCIFNYVRVKYIYLFNVIYTLLSPAQTTKFSTKLLVKEKLVNLCRTHEQIELGRLCGVLSQGKVVQLYAQAIKTCQGKLLGKKLVHRTHEQGKLPRNLSRKTWSSVRDLT